MRSLAISAALATLLLLRPTLVQGAEPRPPPPPQPDGAVAFLVGAATVLAGFAAGGTLVAASGEDAAKNEAGWLIIESGFALAPLTSHAVVGEWWRGAAFASIPTATTLGSVPIFLARQDAIENGVIAQQEGLWWLFAGGLAGAVVGVVDATFAPGRALHLAPALGPHDAGLILGGAL
jgi:hypothetical protein